MTGVATLAPPRCDRCGELLATTGAGRLLACPCLRGRQRPVPLSDGRDRAAGAETEERQR